MKIKIPFVDLSAQYKSIKTEIDNAIAHTLEQTSFIGGQAVKDFETGFAKYIDIKNVIGCANGTDSLEIILKAMGIGTGDEVIVPAASWISTSEAVSSVGATPVFVDILEDYYTINPQLIEAAINPSTKAIIPVHLYGHPADMPVIMEIAKRHQLKVIEDCAQSHGATINGKKTGSFGDAASFSFYPGKNLGAYGDAGCMATNDEQLAETLRMIANHGQMGKHNHLMEGRNSRLDGLQAAILLAKLSFLPQWTQLRIEHAETYNQQIVNPNIKKPICKTGYKHVYHLYVIRVHNRNELKSKLNDAGIETAIHYPVALPFLPCYSNRKHSSAHFPVAASYQGQILSIPMYAELQPEQIAYITDILNER